MFAPIQENFSRALLDAEHPMPGAFVAHNTEIPEGRFAVYRNNVVVGLVDALAARFPAMQRIVGEEFFRAMAQIYVRAQPPRSPLMMFYGDTFPDFIAAFAPAHELDYLPDVARLEAARTRAHHAADAAPVNAAALQSISEADLADLRIERHPSAEIVRSTHPIVTIWAMNSGEREVGAIEDWCGEDALIVRPGLDVFLRVLPAGGAAFLAALFSGACLAAATETAHAECEEFDLVANLAGLISSGAITRVVMPD